MMDRNNRVARRLDRERGPERYCSIGGSGGSSSHSEANTTTQNYDLRIAAGNDSTNVSALNSTVTLVDAGAVRAAFGFSRDAFQAAVGGLASSVTAIQDAYSTAKAGEQKVLVAGGLVIIGIVALAAVKGRV